MRPNTDHVKVRNADTGNYEMVCEHCGLIGVIVPPVPVEDFLKMLKKFGNDHKHCQAAAAKLMETGDNS